MVEVEDIIFWILILVAIGISLWLAFGSPDFVNGLLSVIIFVASSTILLWKFLFKFDKRTTVGFEKVKNDIKIIKNDICWIKDNLEENKEDMKKIKKKLRIG